MIHAEPQGPNYQIKTIGTIDKETVKPAYQLLNKLAKLYFQADVPCRSGRRILYIEKKYGNYLKPRLQFYNFLIN